MQKIVYIVGVFNNIATFNIKNIRVSHNLKFNDMKEHNIVYNYGFLADWMQANPSIK